MCSFPNTVSCLDLHSFSISSLESMSESKINFLYFFALIAEEGFLISPCYSLEFCIQMLISFLFSFAFRFSSQLFVRPPQTAILLAISDGKDHQI